MYTKNDFGQDLIKEIDKDFDTVILSRWAYDKYLTECSHLEYGLKDIMMSVVIMEEGPEFEYTEDELLDFAKKLQKID